MDEFSYNSRNSSNDINLNLVSNVQHTLSILFDRIYDKCIESLDLNIPFKHY